MTFAVKTIYNTEPDGTPVAEDVAEDDMPCTYHGPFKDLAAAVSWMEDVYPDGDTDVYEQYADDFDPAEIGHLNDPRSIRGDSHTPKEPS